MLVADMDSTIIGQESIDELAELKGVRTEVAALTERAMQRRDRFRDLFARTHAASYAG